jgi:hypothetical protein
LPGPTTRVALALSPSLQYLHQHWRLPGPRPVENVPRWRRVLSRLLATEVGRILSQYFDQEEAFRANLVQTCDLLARQVDELEGLIEQLGRAVQAELARLAPYVPERAVARADVDRPLDSEEVEAPGEK